VRQPIVYLLIVITLMSLCLVSIPKASCQTQNVKIVSYNYYLDNAGFIDIVGEVQNTGPNYESPVVVAGSVFDSSGNDLQDNSVQIGTDIAPVTYLAPGQKAPFYLEFAPPQAATDGWPSEDVDHVSVFVYLANATQSYSYSDVQVASKSSSIGTNPNGDDADMGVYWVTGTVQNTGSQTAQNVTVLATFYNSTGNVVAVGSTDTLTIASLDPSKSASFKLGAFDINQTGLPVSEKIASYSLMVESLSPILQSSAPIVTPAATTPGSSPAPTNTPGQSTSGASSSPTSSDSSSVGSNNSTSGGMSSTVIAVIAVVVIAIIVVLGAFIVLRTHKPGETTKEKIKRNRS
jgi:uncharacterized membrane protein YciS (DUF1049 family)